MPQIKNRKGIKLKEIIIERSKEGNDTVLLCNNGKLVEFYEEKVRLEGNIYLGKVQKVLPGMQAAFVDIGEEKNAFVHLKDIAPKKDVTIETEYIENIKKENIDKYIKQGQTVLVQIKRDATMRKGPRVSCHINLGNRFIALLPDTPFITLSQKIENKEERDRLKNIVKKYLPKEFGAIIRTSAENKDEYEIKKDIDDVLKIWDEIKEKIDKASDVPTKIYEKKGLVENFLIDVLDKKIEKIWVNNNILYKEVKVLLDRMEKSEQVVLEQRENLLEMYDLVDQIEKRKDRKIWLRCGGFITIDSTEALVAIDVNSGKYVGKDKLEQTVLKVNKEASVEIAKQLRLRDIGGIIIIDYIDMEEEKDKLEVIKTLQDSLKEDRSKTQIIGFTKLNLLEMTRKHICS